MVDQYLHLDAQFVKAEIAKLIEAYPELSDDETLRADAIEGETDAFRIIERALLEKLDAEAMAEGIGIRMNHLSSRAGRFFKKAEAMGALIKNVMRAAQLPKVALPDATITITAGRKSVGIEDLEQIPQGYFKTVRQADKAAIKLALEQGEQIPGAFLVTGDTGLTIRTK